MCARFRASPHTIRVSIRRCGQGWTATVMDREDPDMTVSATHPIAEAAVLNALIAADDKCMADIDLRLQWAHDHPQKDAPELEDRISGLRVSHGI